MKANFRENPGTAYLYQDLRAELGISNASNFNKRVRRHESFKAALEELGLHEVIVGKGRHKNALEMTWRGISLAESSSIKADV